MQQIGELSSEVAEAVAAEVNVVPFSPKIDARTTPIILAPGEAFVLQGRPGQVGGLSWAERRALRQAYDAGQVLHPSVHDVEALHVLVKEGVTSQSSTDPTVLAYALRQESNIPTARIIHDLGRACERQGASVPTSRDEGALQRALDVIISELTHPPVLAAAPRATSPSAGPADWSQNRCKAPSSPRLPTVSTTRQPKSTFCTHASKTRITISSTPAVTGLPPRQHSVPRARKRIRYTQTLAPTSLRTSHH